MASSKRVYTCNQCGNVERKWLGRCPECGAWNSFEETVSEPQGTDDAWRTGERGGVKPLELADISVEDGHGRLETGFSELDRVLGGGFVPGSMVLIGGEPGIGKSTLLLQVLMTMAESGKKCLYISGEESLGQIKMRGLRLRQGEIPKGLLLLSEVDIHQIEGAIRDSTPDFIVIDSIQTMYAPHITSAPGTISQVRECTRRLMDIIKMGSAPLAIVGHVTKEGSIAGPRVLEHMVDAVLLFEGDRHEGFRILRTVKNRFGPTFEVGIFEMTEQGLLDVPNPSQYFLSMRPSSSSGSIIVPIMQGTRPILVEIQALVTRSYLAVPRRTSLGIDSNRLSLMLAILEKRLSMPFFDKDVFVNVVGGMKVQDTAADLALCLALVSSMRDSPLPSDLVAFGEVGLAGEVRPVSHGDLRINEAIRLGFNSVLLPRSDKVSKGASPPGKLVFIKGLSDAIDACF